MLFIIACILIINAIAVALTYYCLPDLEQKEKLIFIVIGIGVIYALTSLAYWISTKSIAIKEISELGKNFITFSFVPINAIISLPIAAKSYNKYKIGRLKFAPLRNRIILILIILIIILIIECSYFTSIQNGIVSLIGKN